MNYKRTTQIPNVLFDKHLPNLTESELKILLIILRQTNGWRAPKGNGRKTRDRITSNQFQSKTGLCRRVVSKAIQSLIDKNLIAVTDYEGNLLSSPKQRTGKSYLYYQPVHEMSSTCAQKLPIPAHQSAYNKTKKLKKTKLRREPAEYSNPQHIRDLMKPVAFRLRKN